MSQQPRRPRKPSLTVDRLEARDVPAIFLGGSAGTAAIISRIQAQTAANLANQAAGQRVAAQAAGQRLAAQRAAQVRIAAGATVARNNGGLGFPYQGGVPRATANNGLGYPYGNPQAVIEANLQGNPTLGFSRFRNVADSNATLGFSRFPGDPLNNPLLGFGRFPLTNQGLSAATGATTVSTLARNGFGSTLVGGGFNGYTTTFPSLVNGISSF